MSQTWLTSEHNDYVPNTLRSKDNLTTKLGPLIEYNMENIFLEK